MTTLLDDSIYESHTNSAPSPSLVQFDKCVKQHKGENHVCVLAL